jgi:predicted nucleic acid-binding protein
VINKILIDTGVLVAISNRLDPAHRRCLDALSGLRAELVSVEGILVEAAYLLRRDRRLPRAAIERAIILATRFVPVTRKRLERAIVLMEKYHDVPMDFVDALLVAVAEEEDIGEVLTLDRRGFLTYRRNGNRRFRLIPADR